VLTSEGIGVLVTVPDFDVDSRVAMFHCLR
jgi:hypothetical protein